jgi:phosphoadenosine phosphosulfate reductase
MTNKVESAQEVIQEARYLAPRLVLACSFQKEDSVLIDLVLSIDPKILVFTIDTGKLFPETYQVWTEIEARYDIRIKDYMAAGKWDKDHCCSVGKVAALDLALENVDGWIAGLRREQGPTRSDIQLLDIDSRGIWKAAPLADWTEPDVWDYIHEHDLPYNALHDRGYDSIGCVPCTIPGLGREGRWAGVDKTECGIHV